MQPDLRSKLREILNDFKWAHITGDAAVNAIAKLVIAELPEWKPAHTYASENAGEYRAWDNGFKRAIEQMKEKWL